MRNDAARQLRAGSSKTVGLIVLDVRNPFFTDLGQRGGRSGGRAAGLSVILGNSDENSARESTYLDLFEEQRVLGVLISPIGDVTARLERLRDARHARRARRPQRRRLGIQFGLGRRRGRRDARRDAPPRQGRRRIAFIGGPFEIRQVADRHAGAAAAVAEVHDARLDVIGVPALSVLAGREAGAAIAARPATERPDAIFAANDLIAMGVLQALMMQGRTGIHIPGDIALIGYDDIDFASAAVVPLSSIRQPSMLIGQTAVEILFG